MKKCIVSYLISYSLDCERNSYIRKGAKRSGREAGHKAKTNESGLVEASGPPNVGSRSKSGNGSRTRVRECEAGARLFYNIYMP
jgi:hypothetical protein